MGFLRTSAILGGFLLVGAAGALVATNPSRSAYEQYATSRLTTYLQTEVCPDAPSILGEFDLGDLGGNVAELLTQQCQTLVQNNQAQIQALVADNTSQQNFVVLTIYKTNLTLPDVAELPSWEFETVGVFSRFITYKAQQS